jgi:hypothetical protein
MESLTLSLWLHQVQALLAATNSSYEVAAAGNGKLLFTADQVAALVSLRDSTPSQVPNALHASNRQLSSATGVEWAAETETGPNEQEREAEERVKALLAAWSSGYRLEDVHSDEPASLGNDVTRPPHLEDCKDLDDMNRCEWARFPAACKFWTWELKTDPNNVYTFGLCFCTLEP